MKTTVEYIDLMPMDKDMERAIVKALGHSNKDACILTAQQILTLMKEYKSQYQYLPTQWEEYIRQHVIHSDNE